MLNDARLVAFAATVNGARAREFYTDVLGLTLRSEDDFALAFDVAGMELRLQKVEQFTPQGFTVLGWQVSNVAAEVQRLRHRGLVTEQYDFLDQDADGIWQAPSGARVAWFKDPDGNLLSLAQYPDG